MGTLVNKCEDSKLLGCSITPSNVSEKELKVLLLNHLQDKNNPHEVTLDQLDFNLNIIELTGTINLIGDVNDDGIVDMQDLNLILEEMEKPIDDQDLSIFDLNGDGKVSTGDVQVVINNFNATKRIILDRNPYSEVDKELYKYTVIKLTIEGIANPIYFPLHKIENEEFIGMSFNNMSIYTIVISENETICRQLTYPTYLSDLRENNNSVHVSKGDKNSWVTLTKNQTIAGNKTFTGETAFQGDIVIDDCDIQLDAPSHLVWADNEGLNEDNLRDEFLSKANNQLSNSYTKITNSNVVPGNTIEQAIAKLDGKLNDEYTYQITQSPLIITENNQAVEIKLWKINQSSIPSVASVGFKLGIYPETGTAIVGPDTDGVLTFAYNNTIHNGKYIKVFKTVDNVDHLVWQQPLNVLLKEPQPDPVYIIRINDYLHSGDTFENITSSESRQQIATAIVNAYKQKKQVVLTYDETYLQAVIPIHFKQTIANVDNDSIWTGSAIAIQSTVGSITPTVPDKMFYIYGDATDIKITKIYTLIV